MAFLDFMKKKGELPADIDLDMPPEPPKMMMDDISAERPIDEELMPKGKKLKVKAKVKKEPELPEIPPLPEMEEDMPALPEEGLGNLHEEKIEGFDLPPPPMKKKGLFSFLKPKKAKELPKLDMGISEMPPLPEIKEEFPEMPPLPEEHDDFSKLPPLPEKHISEEERYAPKFEKEMPIKAPVKLPEMHAEPLKPKIEPIRPPVEEPIKPIVREPIPLAVEEPVHREEAPQVKRKKFITIDNFRQVQDNINSTRNTLKGVDGFFAKLGEVKHEGDKEYAGLRSSLKDIQSKIMFVDKVLFRE